MSDDLPPKEIQATSDALTSYWNILTGEQPDTPQEFLPENSAAKAGLGRTREYEYSDYPNNLIKKAILFKKATFKDLDNRTGDWSSLEVTGSVNSLRYTTKGVDLPDITTRVSAEGKTLERVNDEIDIVYETLKNIKNYFDNAENLNENTTLVDAFGGFAKKQYGTEHLESLDYSSELNNGNIKVRTKWNDNSQTEKKRYDVGGTGDGSTKYLKLLIHTPNNAQSARDQTTCTLRISDKTTVDKFKTILNEHMKKLKPVYQAAISGTSNN